MVIFIGVNAFGGVSMGRRIEDISINKRSVPIDLSSDELEGAVFTILQQSNVYCLGFESVT